MNTYNREPIQFKGVKENKREALDMSPVYEKVVEVENDCKEAISTLVQLRRGIRMGTYSDEYIAKKIEEVEEILKR